MELYHPVKVGDWILKGNIFLAPVAGWTERVFRSICIKNGADFTSTELISSEALTRNFQKTLPLLRRAEKEAIYAVQIFGSKPDVMRKAVEVILSQNPQEPLVIDINAGCPVPKVTKTGAGSALMKDPEKIQRIVRAVVKAASSYSIEGRGVPVTIKLRSGWDDASINYLECAQAALEAGAAMVSLHPRTRAQGYGGKSNWAYIRELVQKLPVPVAGSGDLWSANDAKKMLEETGCAAVMFARGAMGNPFIFKEAKSLLCSGKVEAPASYKERMDAAFEHLAILSTELGQERAAKEMRKTFCAYIKNTPGSSAKRNLIVRCNSIADYRKVCLSNTVEKFSSVIDSSSQAD